MGPIVFKEARKTREPRVTVTAIWEQKEKISKNQFKVESNRSISKYEIISIKQDHMQ